MGQSFGYDDKADFVWSYLALDQELFFCTGENLTR